MNAKTFRFEFEPHVSMIDAEQSLHLAMYSVEGLFGPARVRLDASYHCDADARMITVDGGNEVGATIVKVYTGLLLREIGEDGFRVRPVDAAVWEVADTAA